MTLTEAAARVGAAVIYRRHDGTAEDGVIVSVQPPYVMVRYRAEHHAKATHPNVLTFLTSTP